GSNAGRNIFYSGTVGGVIDGVIRHIPGIAFSCEDIENPNYECFLSEIFPLVSYLLTHPLEDGSFFNVTFPSQHGISHKGCYLARQGMSYYGESPLKEPHPEGKELYWMGGAYVSYEEHEESDVHLLSKGYITVVPVRIKELTDQAALHQHKERFHSLFQGPR
ncbi:MAG: 5'/3'-nucleotidase SurE, partial [Chlamydiae bacterium]|nr:5'/3'-nucleotidase SurE [Chlamydiota bacterium]